MLGQSIYLVGLAFGFGAVFLATVLVIAIRYPNPTPFQGQVFRAILAISMAGVASVVPGFLEVGTDIEGLAIRAGGALAVFVIVYFVAPVGPKGKRGEGVLVGIGIVTRGAQVLMVERRRPEGPLQWQFPAGQVKPSSTPEETVVREIKKETNLIVNIAEKLGERIHPDTKVVCHYFHCRYLEGEPTNLDEDENSQVKWVDARNVKLYVTSDLFPPVEKLINSIEGECEHEQ